MGYCSRAVSDFPKILRPGKCHDYLKIQHNSGLMGHLIYFPDHFFGSVGHPSVYPLMTMLSLFPIRSQGIRHHGKCGGSQSGAVGNCKASTAGMALSATLVALMRGR